MIDQDSVCLFRDQHLRYEHDLDRVHLPWVWRIPLPGR